MGRDHYHVPTQGADLQWHGQPLLAHGHLLIQDCSGVHGSPSLWQGDPIGHSRPSRSRNKPTRAGPGWRPDRWNRTRLPVARRSPHPGGETVGPPLNPTDHQRTYLPTVPWIHDRRQRWRRGGIRTCIRESPRWPRLRHRRQTRHLSPARLASRRPCEGFQPDPS